MKKIIKIKRKLKPFRLLNGNWTKVANLMIFHIPDAYAFKVYVYLCYRYNCKYDYAFPSLNTIACDTNISRKKVQNCIKWLEEQGFIVRYKRKGFEHYNNCYYIRYVDGDNFESEEKEIIEAIEKEITADLSKEIEIDVYVDEYGHIVNS